MSTSHLGLSHHTQHISSPHSKPGKNRPLWTYNLRKVTDRYIRPIIRFPKQLVRAVALILYFLYRYVRTRSCRARGCERHGFRLYKFAREAPRALCVDREREVSPPPRRRWYHSDTKLGMLEPSKSNERRRRYNQVQSLLFAKLPGEIRARIYEFAIAGRALRVEERLGRMSCVPCVEEEERYSALDLLVTCRKIYAEAIEILYARNILVMGDPLTFLDFSATVLPKRLEAVRYLVFCFRWDCLTGGGRDSSLPVRLRYDSDKDTWDVVWEFMGAHLKRLHTVAVALYDEEGYTIQVDLAAFRSLLKVSDRAKVFVALEGPINLEGDAAWASNAQFTVQYCNGRDDMRYLGRKLSMNLADLKRLDDDIELPYPLASMHEVP